MGRGVLGVLDRLLPRAEELVPAVLSALIGLIPLVIARTYIAWQSLPAASPTDLLRVQYGDIEAWSLIAFFSALILRHTPSRLRPVARLALHAFATAVLLLSVTDLVYFAVTGSRSDVDLALFVWNGAAQVAPVFLSELKPGYVAAVIGVVAVGMAPVLLRVRPAFFAALGRFSVLLILPVIWLEIDHRPRPQKALRILQPSFIEMMWWDALERLGDVDTPPTPEEMVPVTVARVREREPFNVVLVLLESLGAKSTTLRRSELATTPNLARLAAAGWWAPQAYGVVPHTSKAIVTTLCGTWPNLLSDIREAKPAGLPQRCLPDLLKELGFRTAFFQTAHEEFEGRGPLVHRMGFDRFRSRDTLRGGGWEPVNYFGIEDRAMIAPGVSWSVGDASIGDTKTPFFATYLTMTTHHDYVTPSHWRSVPFGGVKPRQAQYFNAVRYVDDFVGRLVQAYTDAGLLDNTLFIFQGDHGEAFNEHGRSMHDLVIYEEGLHIPLVVYGPGVLPAAGIEKTGIIEGLRQQIDLLPTVLDLLGAEASGGLLPGRSLFTAAEEGRTLFYSCWRSHRCLAQRVGPQKIIDHYRDQPMQLFDLVADPRERTSHLGKLPPEAASSASAAMRAWRARVNGRYLAVNAAGIEAAQTPDGSAAVGTWGGQIDLLGCTLLTPTVLPAEAVWARCRWRAREKMSQAWRIDARITGNFKEATFDLKPLEGLLPTFAWRPGWAVEDDLRLIVPPDALPGVARISVGWERYGGLSIPLDGGGARVDIGEVTVLPPLHPYELGGATPVAEEIVEPPSEDPDEGE